jgi:DNA-binding transcriptional LysR family regulator
MGIVPGAVHLFQKMHPRTTIEIASRHDPEMTRALLARDFDIGIGFGPSEPKTAVSEIRATLVDRGDMVYVDHPSSVAASSRAPIRLSQIDQKRLIGLTAAHHLGITLRDALRLEGVALSPGIQVQTYYIARTLVADGTGCAVIDEFTANAHAADIVVRAIEPALRFGVYAYSRALHPLSKRSLEFIDCLRTVCQRSHVPEKILAPA